MALFSYRDASTFEDPQANERYTVAMTENRLHPRLNQRIAMPSPTHCRRGEKGGIRCFFTPLYNMENQQRYSIGLVVHQDPTAKSEPPKRPILWRLISLDAFNSCRPRIAAAMAVQRRMIDLHRKAEAH
jgi:hypothetical protein